MKIAYLISGHVKQFEKCKNSHKKILNMLDEHEVDCFISTYENDGILKNGTKFHDIRDKNDFDNTSGNNIDVKDIVNFFLPKLLEVESYTEYSLKIPESYKNIVTGNNSSFFHITRLYKKILDSIRLMERYEEENGIVYDFFIRNRFDLLINIDKFDFDGKLRGINSSNDFHDVFFYGNRINLNKLKNINEFLLNLKKNAINILNESKYEFVRIPYHNSEQLLTEFLKENNVPFVTEKWSAEILRK